MITLPGAIIAAAAAGVLPLASGRIAVPPLPEPTEPTSSEILAQGWTPIPTDPPDPESVLGRIHYFGGDEEVNIDHDETHLGDDEGVEPYIGDSHPHDPPNSQDDVADLPSPPQDDIQMELVKKNKKRADSSTTSATTSRKSTTSSRSSRSSSSSSSSKKTSSSSSTTTDWIQGRTCGWRTAYPSSAWMCGSSSTCITTSGVVGCKSSTRSSLIATCLGYTDYINGLCNDLSAGTGCCTSTKYPACGTYLWDSHPKISMFRCFATTTTLTLLDSPKYLVDGSAYSATATRSPSNTASATDDSEGEDAATTVTGTSAADSSGSGSGSSSKSKAGPIAGGVVGGLAALGLVGAGMFWFRRRDQRAQNAGAGSSGEAGGGEEYKDAPFLPTELDATHHHEHHELMGDAGILVPSSSQQSPKWPGPDGRLLDEYGNNAAGDGVSTTLAGSSPFTDHTRAVSSMSGNVSGFGTPEPSAAAAAAAAGGVARMPSKAGTIVGGELDGSTVDNQTRKSNAAELP